MLHISHRWLLVTTSLLFSSGVSMNSTNLCKDSDINGFKTWGPNCQRLCHCRKESACDSRGYCANGCMHGWTRLTPSGSCSVQVLKNSTLNKFVFSGWHNNYNSEIGNMRHAFTGRIMPLYMFSQDEHCRTEKYGEKLKYTHLQAQPPILLQEFTVIFKVKPLSDEITTAIFKEKNFEQFSVNRELKYDPTEIPNSLSVKRLRNVLVDYIIIFVESKVTGNCSPAVIQGFVLSGKPVCPYGKWGIRCEQKCPCRCRSSECHPTSGRCLKKGLMCPAKTFGQLCTMTCSTACSGNPRECHPLTGICKECQQQNMTGISCMTMLTREEMMQRDRECTDTLEEGSASLNVSKSINDQLHPSIKGKYGVAILVLAFVIIFVVICCIYIQMVQYCAKRRIKRRLHSLDEARRRQSSLATYTEFKKEFVEMEKFRKGSIYGRSRTDHSQRERRGQLEGYASQSEGGTSQTSRIEPRSKDASKPSVMSASGVHYSLQTL